MSDSKLMKKDDLPLYQSHKVVGAFQIAAILKVNNGVAEVYALKDESENYSVYVSKTWLDKHNPQIGGYFVMYDDSYQSYSPAKAFEAGYTPYRLPAQDFVRLDKVVFPSEEQTISVALDKEYGDEYEGGAHLYSMRNCMGFEENKTKYIESRQTLQFVKKEKDGSMTPGLQSEQVVLALLDRHKKLNKRFPSPENDKQMKALQDFLDACEERVQNRMDRGVMGKLEK